MKLKHILLILAGIFAFISCSHEDPITPADPEYVVFTAFDQYEIGPGHLIYFTVKRMDLDSYSYEFVSPEGESIQSGDFLLEYNSAHLLVGDTDYKGIVTLSIFGFKDGKRIDLGSKEFLII